MTKKNGIPCDVCGIDRVSLVGRASDPLVRDGPSMRPLRRCSVCAAAPELLEALEVLTEHMVCEFYACTGGLKEPCVLLKPGEREPCRSCRDWERATAAIARARGGA